MTALGPVCGGWEQQTATGVSTVRTGDLCVTTATVAAVLSPHAELALSRTGTAWPPHLSTPTPPNSPTALGWTALKRHLLTLQRSLTLRGNQFIRPWTLKPLPTALLEMLKSPQKWAAWFSRSTHDAELRSFQACHQGHQACMRGISFHCLYYGDGLRRMQFIGIFLKAVNTWWQGSL